jgi:anti-sigma-K factor RskA
VKKWTKRGTWRGVIVGVVAIVGVVVVTGTVALAYRHSHRPITDYTVAMPGAPFGGGGTC